MRKKDILPLEICQEGFLKIVLCYYKANIQTFFMLVQSPDRFYYITRQQNHMIVTFEYKLAGQRSFNFLSPKL